MKKTIALILAVTFLMSCTGMMISEMTDNRRALFLVKTYMKLKADYERQVLWPQLTPVEISTLKSKRQTLLTAYTTINTYGHYLETGQVITDEMLESALVWLDALERGWLDRQVRAKSVSYIDANKKAVEAGLIGDTMSAHMSPALAGLLVELIRSGIHALATVIEMRGMTDEMATNQWNMLWLEFKTFDPNQLPIVE